MLYSTFLGGSAQEIVAGIALDSAANLYVAGTTFSANLPTTPGAYSGTLKGSNDVFVARIDNRASPVVLP
ncbi:MAG TPA: SBBP repeat-containing protein [Bryobacteraceae bacterium]|nr:SBBP repeat-containing protein [Bryobacteraceae bacterium]